MLYTLESVSIRFFKKEPQIETVLIRELHPESIDALGFAPIGLDEPYRVIVANNPVNWRDPQGLFAVGISGSESTEAGVVSAGAGQTGSLGVGVFYNQDNRTLSAGGFASWGGFAGGPGWGASYPSNPDDINAAFGAFAGGGANVWVSNARTSCDLKGPFKTASVNLGWKFRLFSAQLSFGTAQDGKFIWMFSYGGPIPGIPVPTGGGYGFSASLYNTNTWTK